MNSIFRYPGGKSRRAVQQLILSYAPADYREYREPFVGGWRRIFWSAVFKDIGLRINDLNLVI